MKCRWGLGILAVSLVAVSCDFPPNSEGEGPPPSEPPGPTVPTTLPPFAISAPPVGHDCVFGRGEFAEIVGEPLTVRLEDLSDTQPFELCDYQDPENADRRAISTARRVDDYLKIYSLDPLVREGVEFVSDGLSSVEANLSCGAPVVVGAGVDPSGVPIVRVRVVFREQTRSIGLYGFDVESAAVINMMNTALCEP